jgi:hypothetical protein
MENRRRQSHPESRQDQLQPRTELDKRNQLEITMDELGLSEEERPILRALARLPKQPPVQLSEGFYTNLLEKLKQMPLEPSERKITGATETNTPPSPQRDIPPKGKSSFNSN